MGNDFTKGIINYTSRDYESILKDFWELIPKLTQNWSPELNLDKEDVEFWSPEANSDPGVVLAKWVASVADMLGINLDWVANEMYAPTVSQRKDAEKLFALIGYQLGWYTAARTEITFTNNTDTDIELDFGFSGEAFTTCTAFTDITGSARVITYNILPMTNSYGAKDSRARRDITTGTDIFVDSDKVRLGPGEAVTRVGIEGELRSYSVAVSTIKANNYIINIPSQHVDTTAIWIKAKASSDSSGYLATQWVQVSSPAEFTVPEPRFAVTYDNYSNAQIQISNYLNQLENYDNNFLTIYWIDCSGVIGCVGKDVFQDYLFAKGDVDLSYESNDVSVSNLSNTVELPHTNTVTGKSPETAKEAYRNSRNYINTWDSLITLPDFNRFLNREPGVDCGKVIDCQKALEINLAILEDSSLTDAQKQKQFITNLDFPAGNLDIDWEGLVSSKFDKIRETYIVQEGDTGESIARKYEITYERLMNFNNVLSSSDIKPGLKLMIPNAVNLNVMKKLTSNFKTYTAMCFAIHNDFQDSIWGNGIVDAAQIEDRKVFTRYKPPIRFITNIVNDYRPLQAMSVELEFGYVRVFPFYVVGQIYPVHPVTRDVGANIVKKVQEDLQIYFSPANRHIGDIPTIMEVVDVIRNAHELINYFDAGSLKNPVINWKDCDIDYFNAISFAKYDNLGNINNNLRIAPEYIVD